MQNAEWGASRGLQQGHLDQAPLLPAEGIVRDGPGAPESRAGDEIPALPRRDLTGPEDGQPLGDSLHPLRVVGVVKAGRDVHRPLGRVVGDQQPQADSGMALLRPAEGLRRQLVKPPVPPHDKLGHPVLRNVPLNGLVQQRRQGVRGEMGTDEKTGGNDYAPLINLRKCV